MLTTKELLRQAEERLAEHINSEEQLDLSIGYAVTFARANMICDEMALHYRRTVELPWWFKGTVEK
jgi:hypothetical protein